MAKSEMRWFPLLPALTGLDEGSDNRTAGEPERGENTATELPPAPRWSTKLFLLLFVTIGAAAIVLWATFLIWLAIKMIVGIAETL